MKKMQGKKVNILKEKMVSAADMPRDVVMGKSVLTVFGNIEVCIENYKKIIEYTDSVIRVLAKDCQIIVKGRCLRVEYYSNDEMKIAGCICSIEYK